MRSMTESNHLERLSETLQAALRELEAGEHSARALGYHDDTIERDEYVGEWTRVYTQLRNLASIVLEKHLAAQVRDEFRARFDLTLWWATHSTPPTGRGTWNLAPIDPATGVALLEEEFEYCGDINTLMDGKGAFRLPHATRRYQLVP